MSATHKPTFMSDFRKFFFRGLAILLPSVVTIGLLIWALGFVWNFVARPINGGVRSAVVWVGPMIVGEEGMPAWYRVSDDEVLEARARLGVAEEVSDESVRTDLRREGLRQFWVTHWYLQGIGFVVGLMLVYLAGFLVGNYIGRRIYARVESWVIRIPGIKQVYPSVKQVTDFLLGEGEQKKPLPTGRVVLVEYPRKGIWTVGLMTGDTMVAIEGVVREPCVTVFIPSSPTPFTGYTITLPANEVHELPISLDEALRFVVSGGVLVPPRQQVGEHREIRSAGARDLAEEADAAMMGAPPGASPGSGERGGAD